MPFQSYVQLTMLENHIHHSEKPVKLMERSIFSARYCFVENMYKSGRILGCEYEVLDEWFKFVSDKDSSLNLNVDLIIYLRTTPEKVNIGASGYLPVGKSYIKSNYVLIFSGFGKDKCPSAK